MSTRVSACGAIAAAALTFVAGAGAENQPAKKVDRKTPIVTYLTSIGINPATVVRQTGLKNYAGPKCPGVGWTCTTSLRAVQVAAVGGQNKFECARDADHGVIGGVATNGEMNTCVIVQRGTTNNARCKMKDTADSVESQRCIIDQAGAHNVAVVDQLIEQRTGSDQDARQDASVAQREGTTNHSQVHQNVKQQTSVDGTQNQNAHQVAIVHQQANGSGNFSHVHQSQDLRARGAATAQNQNVAPLPTAPAFLTPDCDPEHKNSTPSACANVTQIAGKLVLTPVPAVLGSGGKNESHLHQMIHESAKTTVPSATQTQETAATGIEGLVDQYNPPDLGTNRKTSHQDGRQRAEGGAKQIQVIDPNCCGTGTTVGGTNNMAQFNGKAIQSASMGAAAFQFLAIESDTTHLAIPSVPPPHPHATAESQPSSTGSVCHVHHHASNNSDSVHFTFTEEPCAFLDIRTVCVSASAAEVFETDDGCTPPPSAEERRIVASTPTFGQPIPPPDFGEPSDFPGPPLPG